MSITTAITRNFSTSLCLAARFVRRNPGVRRQVNDVEGMSEAMEMDPEGFGDVDSNFLHVHKLHKNIEEEQTFERHRIRQHIIKHKYFRESKLPNFLTYAEKEQIRYLHQSDPEQWSIHTLADSFPASPSIVGKVLRSNWKFLSPKRLKVHDAKVSENWKLLEKGEFEDQLPKEFVSHVKQFINRQTVQELPRSESDYKSSPISKEFSSLVNVGNISPTRNHRVSRDVPQEETYIMDKVKSKKTKTLELLKQEHPYMQQYQSDSDNVVAKTNQRTHETEPFLHFPLNSTEKEIVISQADQKRYEMSVTKDRIHIPHKLRRRGATYRLEDCYYDDDGEFLYRVPGMSHI